MRKLLTIIALMLITLIANAQPCPDDNHPHAIDLGLPSGTKWACCNVDASKPEDYGGYYAWGETEEKDNYRWYTYKHGYRDDDDSGTSDIFDGSTYWHGSHKFGNSICGTSYDVAHVKWGNSWQMPTYEQLEEFLNNCDYEWITLNGINGMIFTSKINKGKVFFPAAGNRTRQETWCLGEQGSYHMGTRSFKDDYYSDHLLLSKVFGSGIAVIVGSDSSVGRTVRPVTE